eukprot:TRINITY_DN64591_c0_g1_i1.p1 TRINITY_DN64591_c0_g1~~TRINITY_DN64591_c0_g1_i1.p1  ORF type:complete len:274 (+),score=72.68 TRINITY_DN64591_c0_g1_i1:64-822(+)
MACWDGRLVPRIVSDSFQEVRNKLLWELFVWQLFRQWSLPDIPELPGVRHALVIGSSVAKGEGAEAGPQPGKGWAQHLADALWDQDWRFHNLARGWTRSQLWHDLIVQKVTSEQLKPFSMVVLSLSLGNEGFASIETEEKRQETAQHFLRYMRMATRELRQRMNSHARLVLGGPYANNGYSKAHLAILEQVRDEMATWEEVDYFVDFMKEPAQDGQGHWQKDSFRDGAHPNSRGHHGMFQCIDPAEIGRAHV